MPRTQTRDLHGAHDDSYRPLIRPHRVVAGRPPEPGAYHHGKPRECDKVIQEKPPIHSGLLQPTIHRRRRQHGERSNHRIEACEIPRRRVVGIWRRHNGDCEAQYHSSHKHRPRSSIMPLSPMHEETGSRYCFSSHKHCGESERDLQHHPPRAAIRCENGERGNQHVRL